MTFLASCNLKQSVNLPFRMVTDWTSFCPQVIRILLLMSKSVILSLIMPLSNALLPFLMVHILHKVQYRRYDHINMSDLHSDLKNTSFVKSHG